MLVCMSILTALIGASCLACGPHFYQRIESISKQFCGRCYFNCAQEHLSYSDIKYLLQYIRSRKTESVKDELISSIINQEDNTESIPNPEQQQKHNSKERPSTFKSIEALAHEIDLKETEQKIISYTDITKTPSETGSTTNTLLKTPEISIVIKDSTTALASNTNFKKEVSSLKIKASYPVIAKTFDKEVSGGQVYPRKQQKAETELTPKASDTTYKQKPSKVIFSQKVSKISVSPRISNASIEPTNDIENPILTTSEGSRTTVNPKSSTSSITTQKSENSHTSLSSNKTIVQEDSKILDQKNSSVATIFNKLKSSMQENPSKLSFEQISSDVTQKINKPILKTQSVIQKKTFNSSCSCKTLNKCSGVDLNKKLNSSQAQEIPSNSSDKENYSNDSGTSMKSIQQPGSAETAIFLKSSGSYLTALASETSTKTKSSEISAKKNILQQSSSEKAAEKKSMLQIKKSLISEIYTKANPNPSNLVVTESGSLIPFAPNNSETLFTFEDLELCELLTKPLLPKSLRHLSAVTENVSGTEEEKQG